MTTKADTSVKFFHHAMPDAPVCSGTAGALIQLLDACLIDGFSVRTPDSVVVSDGVATVSISAGNPYEKHAVVAISGASVSALNAEWKIASADATAFTFACPGVPDGAVTGASAKRAGAGWAKPFSGENLAAYQSQDPTGTQLYLRINDTDARYSQARGYENMTDAAAGSGDFPQLSLISAANFTWPKSDAANSTARDWAIIADGAFMWVLIKAISTTGGGKLMHHFGDIVAFDPLDKYGCTITALRATAQLTGANHAGAGKIGNTTGYGRFYARGVSQLGAAVQHGCEFASNARWSGELAAAPLLSDKIHIAGPVFALAAGAAGTTARGRMPGAVCTIDAPTFADLTVVEQGDRAFLAVESSATAGTTAPNSIGICLFDIKGPWR
ncbi:MAG: hypothetical protein RBT67_07740 [Thauera sp.]|jgi:hypothetical protein|nr:hypothetical protein [Thauera sp.]